MNVGDLRERLLGDRDRLGWWTLPVFLAVGLIGAVLAGGLATIYYSSQVNALAEETRSAREEASNAREEIRAATDDALAAINEQVDAVRQSLTIELPLEDALDVGIAVVRAFPGPAPSSTPPPEGENGQGQANSANQEDPPAEGEQPPRPPPDRGDPRFGSAFPIVRDAGATFFITAYSVIESPYEPGERVPEVELITASGTRPAEVHSLDRGLDLVMLRVDGEFDVPSWRPADESLTSGDKLWVVGLTPNQATAQIQATVASVAPRTLVTDLVLPGFLRGGPLVDLDGQVVGIATPAYRPFGGEGDGHVSVPIRVLCERLLRCTAAQEGAEDATAEPDGG